eukprot:m.96051 g.96051  ORF g.96051 m.96051 type:complete len:92 (-) comp51314_c0_seq13:103-378(-)
MLHAGKRTCTALVSRLVADPFVLQTAAQRRKKTYELGVVSRSAAFLSALCSSCAHFRVCSQVQLPLASDIERKPGAVLGTDEPSCAHALAP